MKILDKQMALTAVAGNEQLAQTLLQTLQEQLSTYREQIRDGLEKRDLDMLKAIVHKLSGALNYVGAPALKAICDELDCDDHRTDPINWLQKFPALQEQIDEVLNTPGYD